LDWSLECCLQIDTPLTDKIIELAREYDGEYLCEQQVIPAVKVPSKGVPVKPQSDETELVQSKDEKIVIANYLLEMPQVRSITHDICDSKEFFPSTNSNENDRSWTLSWGYPQTKRRFAVAETGFFWDAMHIDTQGLYQYCSLNTSEGLREILEFVPPRSARQLIQNSSLPNSKYRQPQDAPDWEGVVFACQNPSDRSIHSVASTEDWWRFLEDSCKYYGPKLYVKLHPWNNGDVEARIREIATRYGCTAGKVGHGILDRCEHVVLFNSTFSVDCMLRQVPVKQGASGYFSSTGAVTHCHMDPKQKLSDTSSRAEQLLDFLVWRYCFSMDCSLDVWKTRLRHFSESRKMFPLLIDDSYGAYLLDNQDDPPAPKSSAIAFSTESNIPPLISFCTTCMGRLHHLCQTLPQNIEVARTSGVNVEFVVLDYNSQDHLKEWMLSAMAAHIESGLISVFHLSEPEFYHSSHAKNVAHRLARGTILCNLDADNFLTPGFLRLLSERASSDSWIMFGHPRDATGKVALRRQDFHTLGGYDENLKGYGYDDVDLIRRATKGLGLKSHQDRQFNSFVRHSHDERVAHMEISTMKESNQRNRKLMQENIASEQWRPNGNANWGEATVVRNYSGDSFSSLQTLTNGEFSLADAKRHHHYDQGLSEALIQVIDGSSPVIDFGCGLGSYLRDLSATGVQCIGIDNTPNLGDIAHFDNIIQSDLSLPLELDASPGTVLCLEVAEHVPSCHEQQLIENIDRFCKHMLIMSWAVPGQKGIGHINCRSFEYVRNRFAGIGFSIDEQNTLLLRKSAKKWWFRNNATVYTR